MLSPQSKKIGQLIVDNAFWVFLAIMIILGSTIEAPWVNVGLTAR